MTKTRAFMVLTLLAAFALLASACGDDDSTTADTTTTADDGDDMADDGDDMADDGDDMADDGDDMADDGDDMADDGDDMADDGDDMADDMATATPGEGVTITMGRANWDTGYFQAQVHKQMLEELGYAVTEPSELELGPSLAYLGMAQGDLDFWANSWYPGHSSWHKAELPDGSLVGDHLTIVGEQMIEGGPQGFVITKSVADEYGITHLDQLNDDPEITALFDIDGNGKADIYGCPDSWTCDNIIDSQIAFSGWDNIEQIKAGYDAMVAEAESKANAGEPMVLYTWAPSGYVSQFRPGDNVYWLAMEEVLDDSNPTAIEGGEDHDQRPGQVPLGPDLCPAAANADNCQVGWVAADILVTANSEFLDANPAAWALWDAVVLSPIDVTLAILEQVGGKDTEAEIAQLAADWIANNRDKVDPWLDAARAAA